MNKTRIIFKNTLQRDTLEIIQKRKKKKNACGHCVCARDAEILNILVFIIRKNVFENIFILRKSIENVSFTKVFWNRFISICSKINNQILRVFTFKNKTPGNSKNTEIKSESRNRHDSIILWVLCEFPGLFLFWKIARLFFFTFLHTTLRCLSSISLYKPLYKKTTTTKGTNILQLANQK